MTIKDDPIFAAIERHRELSKRHSAAADVSTKLLDGPEFEAADKITASRRDELAKYADTLIRTGSRDRGFDALRRHPR
ncbi:hypothetical protein [Bradyrhizobium sp. UFLA05-112]